MAPAQVFWFAVTSDPFLTRLYARGDTFHAIASAMIVTPRKRGRHWRSEKTRTMSGTAA